MEKVCNVSDVPPGSMKGFEVGGNKILVANVDGSFYSMDAVCSHMQGYLPSGKLSGKTVICPVHGSQYDLATGKVVKNVSWMIKMATRRTASDLRTFPVEAREGQVFVDVGKN